MAALFINMKEVKKSKKLSLKRRSHQNFLEVHCSRKIFPSMKTDYVGRKLLFKYSFFILRKDQRTSVEKEPDCTSCPSTDFLLSAVLSIIKVCCPILPV